MRVSPDEPLGVRGKARLIAEILLTYGPALRMLRRNDLAAMVAAARSVRPADRRPVPEQERDLAIHLGFIVRRVLGVLPTDARCLIRSLVLTRMLARRSVDSRIVIGVKPGPPFEAHAWVEHQGLPVLPPEGFEPLHEV